MFSNLHMSKNVQNRTWVVRGLKVLRRNVDSRCICYVPNRWETPNPRERGIIVYKSLRGISGRAQTTNRQIHHPALYFMTFTSLSSCQHNLVLQLQMYLLQPTRLPLVLQVLDDGLEVPVWADGHTNTRIVGLVLHVLPGSIATGTQLNRDLLWDLRTWLTLWLL